MIYKQYFLHKGQYLSAICFFIAIILLIWGTIWGLYVTPADFQQEDAYRIMYIHVPASWLAIAIYAFMVMSSITFLISHIPFFSILSYASCIPGILVTLISIISGSLWGRPIWGTWWVWDARLTCVVILLFFYLSYYSIMRMNHETFKGSCLASCILLFGAFNLPLIKWSVEWWNTLHQPSSFFQNDNLVHSSMLGPLVINSCGLLLLSISIGLLKVHTILWQKQVRALKIKLHS